MGDRPCKRRKLGLKKNELDVGDICPAEAARKKLGFPVWRLVDNYQEMTYQDAIHQPYTFDKVLLFSMRPPELRFVNQMKLYLVWFERDTKCFDADERPKVGTSVDRWMAALDLSISRCPWIDILGYRVRLRRNAVDAIVEFISNREAEYLHNDFGADQTSVLNLFMSLKNSIHLRGNGMTRNSHLLLNLFLSQGVQDLPYSWSKPVKPINTDRFLIHLLLTMGSFTTEYELFNCSNFKQCFIKARLFTKSEDFSTQQNSCHNLIRRYFREQLISMPLGTRSKDSQFVIACHTLENLLLKDGCDSDDLPPALFSRLHDECSQKVQMYLKQVKYNALRTMHADLERIGIILPDISEIEVATFGNPCEWDLLTINSPFGQSCASIKEQKKALKRAKQMIFEYKNGTRNFTKNMLLVGVAGSGKTTVQEIIGLYSLGQGLYVTVVSLSGVRANQIGGVHAHKLFCFMCRNFEGAGKMAEGAWIKLLTRPECMEVIRRTDVLCWDEILQTGDYLIHATDMVFRKAKKSNRFMGGVLFFATGDRKQTKPIEGRPFLTSPLVMANFLLYPLKTPVRASQDPCLQELQSMSRLPWRAWKDPLICARFRSLLKDSCTFVESVYDDSIPNNALYVFSKREPCRLAESHVLKKMERQYKERGFVWRKSVDTERSMSQTESRPASPATVRMLNSKANEPQELAFYPFAHYEITFNDRAGAFFNTQLAMMVNDIPTAGELDCWTPIKVYAAPAGVKTFPRGEVRVDQLLALKWKAVQVGRAPLNINHLGCRGVTANREQYGLRPRIASTIHALQGDTVEAIVTSLDSSNDLWEKGMATVLLSRTHFAKNMYFAGDALSTANCFIEAMSTRNQFDEYLDHIMKELSESTIEYKATVDLVQYHPFRPADITLPERQTWSCYILVSLRDPRVTYIGATKDLRRRLNEHNKGRCNKTNSRAYLPWGILGFVIGFGDGADSQSNCLKFELRWYDQATTQQIRGRGSSLAYHKISLGKDLVAIWNQEEGVKNLVYIAAGTLENH